MTTTTSDSAGGDLDIILYVFAFLCIGVLSRQFVVARGISLPVHLFMVIAGIIIGIISNVISYHVDPMHLKTVNPEIPFNIYMCILMFDCAFNTEVNYLKIICYHLLVISIPTMVLIYVFIILAGVWLFPNYLTLYNYVSMISVFLLPGPHMMKAYLAPTNVQQDVKTLMEAESLFGNYIAFVILKITLNKHPYYTAMSHILLDFLVGMPIGFLAGKLTIMWISSIFKDFVSQMTIVLALCYGGFALSYTMSSQGFLCVIITGLVISHRRSSMSSHFVQVLNSALELIIFSMTSLTCVSSGVYVVTNIMSNLTFDDILITVMMFVIQNLTRTIMLFVVYQCRRNHLQSKTNAFIMWACNIRGSYALMMSYILLDYGQEHGTLPKTFVLAIAQILLSFVCNSYICSYVIGYLNEDTLSKKKWMIERAARLVIALRKSTVDSLRNAASIADADWNVVMNQTKLKHEFMTAYRYASWLTKNIEYRDYKSMSIDPALEMRNEAIRQINLSEKACYSKLYGLGMLSRQSVISLMYLANYSLKMKKLLEPSDIFKVDNSASFLNKLKVGSCCSVFRGCPNCKVICKKGVGDMLIEQELVKTIKNGPSSLFIRILVVTSCFIDNVAIIYAIMFVLFDDMISARLYVITAHNIMMFLVYLILAIFFTIKNQSFRSGNIWETLYRIVAVVTFMDLLITVSPLVIECMYTPRSSAFEVVVSLAGGHFIEIFKITVIICILTRLLRSLLLVQFIPVFQMYMLNVVIHRQDKELFTECDMALGYIRVITETLSKMNSIITDRSLVLELKYICHKNKLETIQHLSLIQLQHPNVIAALKTKNAMRLTLNAEELTLIELKEMGVIGEMDSDLIHKDILTKMVAAQNFPYFINPSAVRAVLLSIPWIDGDLELLKNIESVGHIVKFYANDVIVGQGYLPGGLFIILHGVVRVESVRRQIAEWSTEKVPYFCSYHKSGSLGSAIPSKLELHGFCTRGNVIGELAFLKERPGHKTYRCATYVETFFVSCVDLSEICKRSYNQREPLTQLEMQMWRVVAIRQAVRIIHRGAYSFNISRLTIYSLMSESYIVDGNATRVLAVQPNEVSAVILISGYVSQFHTELRYVAPCILPYNQQKFISHPEIGPRVIYLILRNLVMAENTLDGLIPEEPQMANYEDSLTISSGSSDLEPYRRENDDKLELMDESDFIERMFTSGMTSMEMDKVKAYRVRTQISFSI